MVRIAGNQVDVTFDRSEAVALELRMPKTKARHPYPPSVDEISAPRLKCGIAIG